MAVSATPTVWYGLSNTVLIRRAASLADGTYTIAVVLSENNCEQFRTEVEGEFCSCNVRFPLALGCDGSDLNWDIGDYTLTLVRTDTQEEIYSGNIRIKSFSQD